MTGPTATRGTPAIPRRSAWPDLALVALALLAGATFPGCFFAPVDTRHQPDWERSRLEPAPPAAPAPATAPAEAPAETPLAAPSAPPSGIPATASAGASGARPCP